MRSFKSFVACLLVASVAWATGCSQPTAPTGGPTGAAPKVATTPPPAASPASAQTEIQGRYDAMAAAMKARDPKAYMDVLHETYKETDQKGTSRERLTEAGYKEQFATWAKEGPVRTVKIAECVQKDNSATVTTEQTLTGAIADSGDATKTHELSVKTRTTDMWTKTPAGWKIQEMKVVDASLTIDGKTPEEFAKSQAGAKPGDTPKAGKPDGDKGEKPEAGGEKGEKPEAGDDKGDKPEKGE